jgi:hypothetical protein
MAARAGLVGSSPCNVQGSALVGVEAEISLQWLHGWSEDVGPAGGGVGDPRCWAGGLRVAVMSPRLSSDPRTPAGRSLGRLRGRCHRAAAKSLIAPSSRRRCRLP